MKWKIITLKMSTLIEEKERFLDRVKYIKPPPHITEINVCRELEREAAYFCNTISRKLNHMLA